MKHRKLLTAAILWMAVSVIVMIFVSCRKNDKVTDQQTFNKQVSVEQTESKVGALVKLKEAIHGTEGITYRYIVKTDCDKWNFESRYVSKNLLAWVDNKTSAAEVFIYSVQVRHKGTVYASGTYYTVPILEDLSSEDIPLEEWKQNLIKQAYQAYKSDAYPNKWNIVMIAIILSVAGAILLYFMNRLDDKAMKIQHDEAVEIQQGQKSSHIDNYNKSTSDECDQTPW